MRRSNSKFIGYTSHDYIMNETFLKIFIIFYLIKLLQGLKNDQDIIIIPRKHLPLRGFILKTIIFIFV